MKMCIFGHQILNKLFGLTSNLWECKLGCILPRKFELLSMCSTRNVGEIEWERLVCLLTKWSIWVSRECPQVSYCKYQIWSGGDVWVFVLALIRRICQNHVCLHCCWGKALARISEIGCPKIQIWGELGCPIPFHPIALYTQIWILG